jgi:hypothetical protein
MEAPTATRHIALPGRLQNLEKGFLLNVGNEVYPVYGSDQLGWTLDSGDLHSEVATQFRYQSLDELFIVIVNFTIATNGTA